jgi:peptidoglycan hydrolase-like protein with peptidoglycan-binding domain
VKPKPDPKVLEIQKSLGFTGKDLDGIMGPKTKAAIEQKPALKRDLDTKTIPLASRPLPSMTVDASKLAQLPNIKSIQSNVSTERRQEIASKIEKQSGTGKLIYKGGDLNPEEQQFLNTYIQALGGGELSKSKDKGYGQKMVYNN